MKQPKPKLPQSRYFIAEWYGNSFVHLSREERAEYADSSLQPKTQQCLPRVGVDPDARCNKKGGVCSLRQYLRNADGDVTTQNDSGSIVTLCPNRFKQDDLIFEWIGQTLLGTSTPKVATEIDFLIRNRVVGVGSDSGTETIVDTEPIAEPADEYEDVGRIDFVLANDEGAQLEWCALELQAVYFSGPAMSAEYPMLRGQLAEGLPFPGKIRRPDFRSSGPKRLMPQLQIKVPSLRRWGKKLAVVVDEPFFESLGEMELVPDISNCDIVWFIVELREQFGKVRLKKSRIIKTTLESAVTGLTAGRPVSKQVFEQRIIEKLKK